MWKRLYICSYKDILGEKMSISIEHKEEEFIVVRVCSEPDKYGVFKCIERETVVRDVLEQLKRVQEKIYRRIMEILESPKIYVKVSLGHYYPDSLSEDEAISKAETELYGYANILYRTGIDVELSDGKKTIRLGD